MNKEQFIRIMDANASIIRDTDIFQKPVQAIAKIMTDIDGICHYNEFKERYIHYASKSYLVMIQSLLSNIGQEKIDSAYNNVKNELTVVDNNNIIEIVNYMIECTSVSMDTCNNGKTPENKEIIVNQLIAMSNAIGHKYNIQEVEPESITDEETDLSDILGDDIEDGLEDVDNILDGDDIITDDILGEDEILDGDIIEDTVTEDSEETEIDIEDENDSEDTEKVSDEELIEKLRTVWGEQLRPVVNGILASYEKLYASGYGLQIPRGLLTNAGIIKSTGDGKRKVNGDIVTSLRIYDAIVGVLGSNFSNYAEANEEPDITSIEQNGTKIYTDLHLACAFGHFAFAKGLKKMLLDKGAKGYTDGSTVTKNWKDIKPWIKDKLEEYFYKAYIVKGVTDRPEDIRQNMAIVEDINNKLSASLKNVILVVEDEKATNLKLRICLDREIDIDEIRKNIEDTLNVGQSSLVIVETPEDYKEGVACFNIIYNKKSYYSKALYAYQVVDTLKEKGVLPAWNNVILGKKLNGEIFTKNFKDTQNSFYAMYGSMGSGKGVMTLNLLASALADDCIVMYMDSKPDSSTALAEITWGNGADGLIYNGVDLGIPLEELVKGCPRDVRIDSNLGEIPDGIFATEEQKVQFLKVNTYLRGLELWRDVCVERSQIVQKGGKNDRWFVVVFDECEVFAGIEKQIVEVVENALTEIKKAKRKDNAYQSDPAYMFCDRWISWRKILTAKLGEMPTTVGRKAEMTSFFIWQTTAFPKNSLGGSILAQFIQGANAKFNKLVGRGAAQAYGSTEFGATDLKKQKNGVTWYDEKFTGEIGGYWAIGSNVNSNDMVVFRPFNVYASVGGNSKGLLVENAAAQGLKEEDLIGVSLLEDGTVNPLIGFEGYTNKLLDGTGKNIVTQIQSGLDSVNKTLADAGFGTDAHHYIYSIYNPENDKHIVENMKVSMSSANRDTSMPDLDEDASEEEAKAAFEKMGIARENDKDFITTKVGGIVKVKKLIQLELNDTKAHEYYQKFILKHAIGGKYNYQTEKGRLSAAIIFGNLVYLCQNFNVDSLDRIIGIHEVKKARGGEDKTQAIIAIGIINDFINDAIPFDEEISQERIMGYLKESMASNNRQVESNINLAEDSTADVHVTNDNTIDVDQVFNNSKFTAYEDDIPVSSQAEMSFEGSTDVDRRFSSDNGQIVFDTSRINATNTRYVNDDSSNIMRPDKINISSEKTRNLLSSLFGTRNEMKRRNKVILDNIASIAGGKSMVIRLAFIGNIVYIGEKGLDVSNLLNNEYGIRIEDILNVHEVIKTFPNLKKLVVDTNIFQNIIFEYGDEVTGIAELFNSTKNLREFGVYMYDSSKPVIFRRENFSKTTNAMKAMLEEESNKMKIDQYATAMATKVRPTQINRCWNGTKKYGGESWNKALNAMYNGKTIRGRFAGFAGNGLLALGTMAFGGIASLGNQAILGVKGALFGRKG